MGAGLGISMVAPFADAWREADEIQLVRASNEYLRSVGENISSGVRVSDAAPRSGCARLAVPFGRFAKPDCQKMPEYGAIVIDSYRHRWREQPRLDGEVRGRVGLTDPIQRTSRNLR